MASELEQLYGEISQKYAPQNGWCDLPHCTECREAEIRISVAKEAARRGWTARGRPSMDDVPQELGEEIFSNGFEHGFDQGYHRGYGEAETSLVSKLRAAKGEQQQWYRRGIEEGQRLAITDAKPEGGITRKKLMEDVMMECRVIGESNPQMMPAMNALRHRLKKVKT